MYNGKKYKEILFITLHLTNGGAERVASELIAEWINKGCRVTIVQLMPDMFINSYPMSSDVSYINLTLGSNRLVKLYRGVKYLVKVMRQNPNATVVSFVKTTTYVVGIASLFTKNRIVVSERNDPYSTPQSRIRRMLRNWTFKRADACVFQTPDARDYFLNKVKKEGTVIANPIDPALPERYEGKRKKKIVAAGRLVTEKNFPMLIKAFALIHDDYPEYKLSVYGRGPLEHELREMVHALKLDDFVEFPGFSDNIYQDMLKCAVYVSSSDYEGMSNSMLEALAMGIPSVVTDCPIGGARMVIKDGINGLLVPVGDEEAMAGAIRKILANEEFAERIGKEAAKIKYEFPVEVIAEKWLNVI